MCQLSKQVSSLQNQSGFGGNTTDNPKNESAKVINLRSRVVPSPVVVEKSKEKMSEEENEGGVENESDGVVENHEKQGVVENESEIEEVVE
ncbi:hypothetical protein A2U01_0071424, partial [Trifolium medium]|nr:hypothetical protein [Trifolium medium]